MSRSQDAWAASGAMALTGRADGPPLMAPAGIAAAIERMGTAADTDPFTLLGERAALLRLTRRGATSCGGGTRLLRTADGELVAVALARADDVTLLPAWVGIHAPEGGTMTAGAWDALGRAVVRTTASEIVERALLLGLAASCCGEVSAVAPVVATCYGATPALSRAPLVVDLSSLWAGPLATRLLRHMGARVVKVESLARPDGARHGDPRFFDLMHAGKESVALDFRSARGIEQLRGLLDRADVVVEASRPRALEQLGIDASSIVTNGPRVWLSITGYGRTEPHRHRVAFGDDAAVAGGLIADAGDGPCFVADAVADPLTGVTAASAVMDALGSRERVLLDVALARVAACVAQSAGDERWRVGETTAARAPALPEPLGRAPRLGEHTDAVMREFGL